MKTLLILLSLLYACSNYTEPTIKESLTVQSLFNNWVEVPNNSYSAGRQLVHGWFGMDRDSIVYACMGTWYLKLYQFDRYDKMIIRDNRVTGEGYEIEFIDKNRIIFNNWELLHEKN